MELITTIALLCQVHPAFGKIYKYSNEKDVDTYQLFCQKQYIKCMESEGKSVFYDSETKLLKCIKDRK